MRTSQTVSVESPFSYLIFNHSKFLCCNIIEYIENIHIFTHMYIKLRLRLPVTKINKFSRASIGLAKMFFDFNWFLDQQFAFEYF